MTTHTLTERETGVAVTVSPGDQVVLRLPENPTTGFRWQAEIVPPAALAVESDDYETALPQAGAAGSRMIALRALTPGPAWLRLKLWRAWEGDRSTTDRLEFPITVQPS